MHRRQKVHAEACLHNPRQPRGTGAWGPVQAQRHRGEWPAASRQRPCWPPPSPAAYLHQQGRVHHVNEVQVLRGAFRHVRDPQVQVPHPRIQLLRDGQHLRTEGVTTAWAVLGGGSHLAPRCLARSLAPRAGCVAQGQVTAQAATGTQVFPVGPTLQGTWPVEPHSIPGLGPVLGSGWAGPQQTMCPWLGPGLEVPSGSLLTLPPGPYWKQSHTRGPQQSQAGVPDLPAGPWEVRACSGRLTPVGTVHPRTAAAKARRNPATRTGGKAVNPPPRGTAGRARLTQHAENPAAAAPTHRGTRENRKLMRS